VLLDLPYVSVNCGQIREIPDKGLGHSPRIANLLHALFSRSQCEARYCDLDALLCQGRCNCRSQSATCAQHERDTTIDFQVHESVDLA